MPLDLNKISQKAEELRRKNEDRQARQSQGELEWYQWKVGINHLRFLPPHESVANKGEIAFRAWRHTKFGLKLVGINRSFVCVERTYPDLGITCPLCEIVKELDRLGYEHSIRPTGHAWFDGVDRQNEDRGVQIVRAPISSVYDWLLIQVGSVTQQDFTDPVKGSDLIIEYKQTPQGPRYDPSWIPGPLTPLHPDPAVVKQWLSCIHDFSKIFKPPSNEDLKLQRKVANDVLSFYTRASVASLKTQQPPQAPPNPTRITQPWCYGIHGFLGVSPSNGEFHLDPDKTVCNKPHDPDPNAQGKLKCMACSFDLSCREIVASIARDASAQGYTDVVNYIREKKLA